MENHEIYEPLTFSACSELEQKIILHAIKLEHETNYIRNRVESLNKSFKEIENILFEKQEDLLPGEQSFFWMAAFEIAHNTDFETYCDACIVYRDLISEKYKKLKPASKEPKTLIAKIILYLKDLAAIN